MTVIFLIYKENIHALRDFGVQTDLIDELVESGANLQQEPSVRSKAHKRVARESCPLSTLSSMIASIPTIRNIPPVIVVGNLISNIYEAKMIQDVIDMREGQNRSALPDFTRDFLIRQYGLKVITKKKKMQMQM